MPEEPKTVVVPVSMAHCYLEMARSVQCGMKLHLQSLDESTSPESFESYPPSMIAIGLGSMAVIYSHLAVEAFTNFHLHDIWQASRLIHDACRKCETESTRRISKPAYAEFYQKFGIIDDFEKLKCKSELRELPTRYKLVCSEFAIRQLHETDKNLWDQFTGLWKTARDFLVHPFPEDRQFNSIVERVTVKYPLGEPPRIAAALMAHVFEELHQVPPEWLQQNTIFRFTGLETLWKPTTEKRTCNPL